MQGQSLRLPLEVGVRKQPVTFLDGHMSQPPVALFFDQVVVPSMASPWGFHAPRSCRVLQHQVNLPHRLVWARSRASWRVCASRLASSCLARRRCVQYLIVTSSACLCGAATSNRMPYCMEPERNGHSTTG